MTIFNKSARKAFITSVKVLDESQEPIPITWSNSISRIGNIENGTGLTGLTNSENIYIRRNDGLEFTKATVLVKHSFSDKDLVLQFNSLEEWMQ